MPSLLASENIIAPSGRMAAVTPSDTADLAYTSRAIYVGTAGNISVVTEANDTITFVGVNGGTTLVGRFIRIRATSTTATNMIAMF